MDPKQSNMPEWLRPRELGFALILLGVIWAVAALRLLGYHRWIVNGLAQNHWLLMGPGYFSFALGAHLALFGNYFLKAKLFAIIVVVISLAIFMLAEAVVIHHYLATGRLVSP